MNFSEHQIADQLETRVKELTAELEKANQALSAEVLKRKQAEEALRQSELRTKLKLDTILSPDREIANLELADIVDVKAIKSMMYDFYRLTNIPIGLNDLEGNVLAGFGWQDICTNFHRIHPETCKHCIESDIKLSAGVVPGEYKLYKCKSNMWDIVTPIMAGNRQVGILFLGQFLFEDEPLDYGFFRSQSRKYGFNEKEYIAALEKVPRLSREFVETGVTFLTKLANMISQLSYSNIKLAQSLAERDALVEALQESEKRERAHSDELAAVLDSIPTAVLIAHDPKALQISGNRFSCEWLHTTMDTNFSKSAPEGEKPEMFRLIKDGVEIPPEEMPLQMSAAGKEVNDYEMDIVTPDGKIRHVLGNARPLLDERGNPRGSVAAFIDITERKRAEDAIKKSQFILAKSQEMAHVGNWAWNVQTGEMNGSDEIYRIYGFEPGDVCLGKDWVMTRAHPDDLTLFADFIHSVKLDGTSKSVDYRIIRQNGETRYVTTVADKIVRDKAGKVKWVYGITQDITERKRAEEALRLSSLYNRSLIEASLDPLVTIGPNGKIMDVNRATEHITGYPRDELIGTDFSDNFTEPEKARAGYQKVFTDGEVWDYPLEIRHKDGHKTPVLYNASVYRDENGKVIGVFAAARNIIELKKAEEALRRAHDNLEELVEKRTIQLEKAYNSLKESERRLAEAQKMAHLGNWDWDLITDEMYWSDEMYRIFGHDPRKFGSFYNAVLSRTHPDDREYVDNAVKRALEGKPFGINHRIVLADGEERVVHAQGEVVFDEKGSPVRMRGTVQNITESKKAEEKIKTLADAVESSDDAIITESLDGIITSWNKGAEQIYGYSAVEILGKNASIFEPHNLKGEVLQLIEKIRKREKIRHYRTLRLRKDGTIINVSVTLSPIFGASGELVAISSIARDITDRIKAEEALAKIEEARKKEIHHRIKNNLQVISSLLDLQAEKFSSKKLAPTSEILEAFKESQNRVISMALIHEELYRGKGDDTLDFSAYLQKLAENLFQAYSINSINVRLYMDLEENSCFDMDIAIPLGIIVNEIVTNSLKHAFTEDQQGEIRIQLCREEQISESNESLFSLKISDNGKGIPEDVDLECFESLGLQLVIALVDQLDGEIETKREQGTEFKITFKVADRC